MRFKEAPPGQQGLPDEGDKIMHICLPVGDTMLLGSDAPKSNRVTIGNNFSISIVASGKEEADKFFNELSAGGQAFMPMSTTFWGSYFGMLQDKFNVNWMISFDEQNPGANQMP